MKHTPGPWKVCQTFYGETYIEGKDGDFVCAFPVCSPNKKDVVMIAAAPEMKDRLKEAKECLIYLTPWWEDDLERIEGVIDSINALLRRIEGDEEAK